MGCPSTPYLSTGWTVNKHEKSDPIFLGQTTEPIFFKGWAGLAGWPIKILKNYKIILVDFGKRYSRSRRYTIVYNIKCSSDLAPKVIDFIIYFVFYFELLDWQLFCYVRHNLLFSIPTLHFVSCDKYYLLLHEKGLHFRVDILMLFCL